MSTFEKVALTLLVGSIAALIGLAVLMHFLDTHGLIHNREAAGIFTKITAVVLFLVIGYSVIPVMIHVFVAAQGKIGNAEVGMVKFLHEHERGVSFTFWGVFTAGLLIALPVMWTDLFGFPVPIPKNQGTIITNIGMTIPETVERSTFKVPPGFHEHLTGSHMSTSQGVFNLEIEGASFENCRYCALHTGSNDDPKIVHINAGISTRKMARPKLAEEQKLVADRLQAAGWSAGHFEYTDPEQITLHGGTRRGDGQYWAKGTALLILKDKRMNDAKPGEDAATAGEFIHFIDVVPVDDPSYRELVFEPAGNTNAAVGR